MVPAVIQARVLMARLLLAMVLAMVLVMAPIIPVMAQAMVLVTAPSRGTIAAIDSGWTPIAGAGAESPVKSIVTAP